MSTTTAAEKKTARITRAKILKLPSPLETFFTRDKVQLLAMMMWNDDLKWFGRLHPHAILRLSYGLNICPAHIEQLSRFMYGCAAGALRDRPSTREEAVQYLGEWKQDASVKASPFPLEFKRMVADVVYTSVGR